VNIGLKNFARKHGENTEKFKRSILYSRLLNSVPPCEIFFWIFVYKRNYDYEVNLDH
jgi:hypothetical protein